MTWFTDNPLERIMTQKPDGRRENTPPVSFSPACENCPYKGLSPCIGYCIKELEKRKRNEPER